MERIPGLLDRAEMIDRCLEALRQAHDAGIDSIIDLTPFDLGRQVWLFEAVAERSPLNVVCATGVYRWVPVVYYGWDEDEIAAHFVREIREGIEGSQIRAGAIKLAWDLEYRLEEAPGRVSPRGMLERTARAAARASKATGVPISCHTRAVDELGTPLLDIFEDEGLDLRAVTIGHSNDSRDLDYLRGLAARGRRSASTGSSPQRMTTWPSGPRSRSSWPGRGTPSRSVSVTMAHRPASGVGGRMRAGATAGLSFPSTRCRGCSTTGRLRTMWTRCYGARSPRPSRLLRHSRRSQAARREESEG